MTQMQTITHEFVEFIPDDLKDNTIYISMEYATAVHKCFCGCQNKVVTPFSSRDWKLIYDGETISLHPSIGNWCFPCHSHYWIRNNKIEWAQSGIILKPNFKINKTKNSEAVKKKRFIKKIYNFFIKQK